MSGSAAELLAEQLETAQRRITQLESCLQSAQGFIKGQSLQAADERKALRRKTLEEVYEGLMSFWTNHEMSTALVALEMITYAKNLMREATGAAQ